MTQDLDGMHEYLKKKQKEKFELENTQHFPIMNERSLKHLCIENDGYETPELNDSLYAHFKGFKKIEGLDRYIKLKALWLESNGLEKIENLQHLKELRCLYLSKNLIREIENLEGLCQLVTLDLSENAISTIQGLEELTHLTTLNIARNRLRTRLSIEKIAECPSITNLDMSQNQLEDTDVLQVLGQLPNLKALRLSGNPIVTSTPNFRKLYLSQLRSLCYLDRPVFEMERVAVAAWEKGGVEAERQAKADFKKKEQHEHRKMMQEFRDWKDTVRKTIPSSSNQDMDNERAEDARLEGIKERELVAGNGIRKLGEAFWAEEYSN